MREYAVSIRIWLVIILLTTVGTISAQTYTATLTGTVTDQNGQPVPNVKVTATNQSTNLSFTAQTSDSGVYTIPFLPVGTYVTMAESSGFKKAVSTRLTLEVNQTARLDLRMEVGNISEQVIVQNDIPVLQSETTNVGQVITGRTTDNLPLNGRSFQQLTLLVPGTVTPNTNSFTSLSPGAFGGRPYVNGNREQTNAFLVDGVSVDETIDNRIGYKPNVDAIQEFKVETSNSSAEFGNVAGAVVNATIKSGTNNFHGNVFEFFRNDALDANLWANNRVGAPKQKLRQNIFGGTFGGPIVKAKAFFFFAYQGAIQRTGGGIIRTVAPVAWRNGDFSSVATPIIDPTTGVQFTNNQIPTARFSAAAKALLSDPSLYPLPNRSGNVDNYVTTFDNEIKAHQYDIKLDFRPTTNDNISGRYSFAIQNEVGGKGALPTDITDERKGRPHNIVINWTRSITSNLVNEARFGFNQAKFVVNKFDWSGIGNANSTLGIPGSQAIPGLSRISITGLSDIGNLAITEDNKTTTLHFGDNLTWLKGRHTIKMGGQLLKYYQNRFYPGNNGLLGFFNYTSAPSASRAFTGFGFADFLLDMVSQKGIGSGDSDPWQHRQNRIGIFVQDDFKFRPNLTLNLGMRWEYTSPLVEKDDRQANFDITTGAQLIAGQNGNSRALYEPYYKGFEPRIGFAWSPKFLNGKGVLRAGYGIVQYMEGTGANLRLPLNPPFFAESDVPYGTGCLTTNCSPTDPNRANRIATGFTGLILRNTPAGLIRIWNPKIRPQFTQQWNVTGEYQLFKETSLSIGYVGHKATHLIAPTDWNQALPGTGAPSTWLPVQQRRPLYSVLPLVTSINGTDSWSISNYHSLQASLRRRFSKGLDFLASYTFGKVLTDNRGFYGSGVFAGDQGAYPSNAYDHRADYGPAFFDVKHNFVLSGTYELPFGKGRAWGDHWNAVVDAILGGWKVSNIVTLHTGFPITVTDGSVINSSLQSPRSTRADRIGDGHLDSPTLDRWFDTTAFAHPALGKFGSSGVGILRGPGWKNWDFTIGKKFSVSESNYFDFRAEFFNFTNTSNFQLPGRDLNSPSTFGKITTTLNESRRVEFVLKYYF